MKNIIYTFLLLFCVNVGLEGQIINGTDTLLGNEWIDYNKIYYKVSLSEDGIYRLDHDDLENAGLPVSTVRGDEMQLYLFGEEIEIYTSTDGLFGANDYIEFFGRKNRAELDQYLFSDGYDDLLNPEFSLFTDTTAYFLSWESGITPKRYTNQENVLENLPPKEDFYIASEKKVFSAWHFKPTYNGSDQIRFSSFDYGEGFGTNLVKTNSFAFNPTNITSGGPGPVLNFRMGTNTVAHIIELKINNNLIKTYDFSGYVTENYSEEFDRSLLTTTTSVVVNGTTTSSDRNIIAYADLLYPRNFIANNNEASFSFSIEADLFKKYIEIENFNAQGSNPILYDVTNKLRIETVYDSNEDKVKFVLPPSNEDRNLILINESNADTLSETINPVSFQNFSTQKNVTYFIISNERLYDNTTTGKNEVEEYANYRSSALGGSYNTSIADVQQLYDQFSYGIQRHAISLRNFTHYINKKLNVEYLFIIGKGREYSTSRTVESLTSESGKRFYVPTFGVPGSDNLIASYQGKTTPIIPIGRLAASTVLDIERYLRKVKLHENPLSNEQNIPDQLWKKRVLHLSGGDPSIQQTLYNFLSDMEGIIEANKYGAEVTTFRKTSSDPIQTATTENIISNINEGVSILTFFGHSAVGTFDFSLEEPGEYRNTGKFPLIISLGCHSGNIHSTGIGLSEAFVLEEDKGAIAFLASSGTAYISPQYNSGKDYYDFVGDEFYGQSIGKVLQQAIKKRDVTQALSVKTLNEQLTLHGDPAIKLYPKDGPDYVLDFESVKTEPSIVSTNLDSFELSFDVLNLGLNVLDSIDIVIQHFLPDNSLEREETLRIKAPSFKESIVMNLPVEGLDFIGKNSIKIQVDPNNLIDELPNPLAEENNSLKSETGEDAYCFYILDNGAKPIFPVDLSIHSKGDVILKASTSNAYLEQQKYLFELDTTLFFNSPLLETTAIEQEGGVVSWEPSQSFISGQTYYWRVTPDSTNTNLGYLWESSSFIYLPTSSEGWNQSHYFQHLENYFDGLEISTENRLMVFDTAGFFINLRNGIWDGASVGYQFDFGNFALSVRPWQFMEEGIAILVADSLNGVGWINSGGDYGSINTANTGSFRTFGYLTNTQEQRAAVINMLENVIPDKSYVFFWTVLKTESSDFNPEEWASDEDINGKSIFSVLEGQGAVLARQLDEAGSIPYNFIYQKGVKPLEEDIAEDKFDLIVTDVFIPIRDTEGTMTSPLIGPSTKWTNLIWNENRNEEDETFVNVFGVTADLSDTTLLYDNVLEMEFLLNEIDAEQYPYIFLEYAAKDEEKRTAPNLNFWRVLYNGLPEAALNPNKLSLFYKDTIQQGDIFRFKMAAENISCFADMDSLLVKYTITDQNNLSEVLYKRMKPLLKADTLELAYSKNTTDMFGKYQFTVEINPNEDQPESDRFNNFGIREFLVESDKRNPLLDVTFDGIHILDGDIVSSNPFIVVDLKDENEFLPLMDISLFDLALEKPDGSIWNIDYNDPSLNFIPSSEDENRAQLEFNPQLDSEGEYKLIVQAKDASDNFSGSNAYEVTFRVILQQSVSNVLNYPNPFSNSTEFIFTLTGNEIPEYFKIQIMTLSGKVVKEITKDDLGPLHIGVNRTDYKWDGTDDFGENLANGVYLYKVNVKNTSLEDLEHFDTNVDSFFKNGLGKLVIIR